MTEPAPGFELQRPRDVPDLLRTALAVYRGNFWTFLALAAAVVIPAELIVAGVGLEQLTSAYDDDLSTTEAVIPTLVAFFVTTPLITATCVYALQDVAGGKRPPIGETLTKGLEAFTPLFLSLLLAALGIALGLALLIVPGIYVAIRWFFIPQAVVLEGLRGVEPLQRSGKVVEGFWRRTFGIVLLANILANLPGLVVIPPLEALAESADREAVSLAGRTLVELITTPFVALAATLLWFDLQARRR